MIGRWMDYTFVALRVPTFRRYYAGQAVSLARTSTQSTA